MKNKLRKSIKALKAEYSDAELAALSQSIVGKVLADADVRNAQTIAAYYSLPDEVCTHQLLDKLIAMGKTVLLPAIVGDEIELRQYTPNSLHPGAYGIPEPVIQPFSLPTGEGQGGATTDVILVPGMAFDLQGNRLGRGKGYYDRLLQAMPNTIKIGICFPFQLLPAIPTTPHDIKMTKVIC